MIDAQKGFLDDIAGIVRVARQLIGEVVRGAEVGLEQLLHRALVAHLGAPDTLCVTLPAASSRRGPTLHHQPPLSRGAAVATPPFIAFLFRFPVNSPAGRGTRKRSADGVRGGGDEPPRPPWAGPLAAARRGAPGIPPAADRPALRPA